MVRSRRARIGLVGSAVALTCVAAAVQPVFGATRPAYNLRVFRGPAGSSSALIAIADDGTAVGQRVLADGRSHALMLTTRRSRGASPFAGQTSALNGIDSRDEAVGAAGTNPVFLAGGRATALPAAGAANAVAEGPLVAVTAVAADGLQHVYVWNPSTGAVRDLGPGIARGISVDAIVVGRTLGGEAAFWTPDGAVHLLGFPGTLLHVNMFGLVVGYATVAGGLKPIMLDIRRPSAVMRLALPRGWAYGSAKDISDSGWIVGDAFRTSAAKVTEGVLWKSRTRPVALRALVGRHAPRAVRMADASGVDDNGLISGFVARATSRGASAAQAGTEEDAFVASPDNLQLKVGNLGRFLDVARKRVELGELDPGWRHLHGDLIRAPEFPTRSSLSAFCETLGRMRQLFEEHRVPVNDLFTPNDANAFADDGIASVSEIATEAGCR
jgi:hypothetical protein